MDVSISRCGLTDMDLFTHLLYVDLCENRAPAVSHFHDGSLSGNMEAIWPEGD